MGREAEQVTNQEKRRCAFTQLKIRVEINEQQPDPHAHAKARQGLRRHEDEKGFVFVNRTQDVQYVLSRPFHSVLRHLVRHSARHPIKGYHGQNCAHENRQAQRLWGKLVTWQDRHIGQRVKRSVVASVRAILDRDLSVTRFIGHHYEKPYIDHDNVGASYSKTVATPANQARSQFFDAKPGTASRCGDRSCHKE